MKHSAHRDVRRYVRTIQKSALVVGSIACGLLWSLVSRSVGLGFMAGVLVSVINFQLMSVDALDMVGKQPKKARSFIISRYALRYAIMFGFIAVIVTRTDLNVVASFIGIFFVQFVLVGERVLSHVRMNVKPTRRG